MLTPKTFSGFSFSAIDNDKDVTKDRNLNTFKMYSKRRKSGVRFPDRKAKNRLYTCHCIAGHEVQHSVPVIKSTVLQDIENGVRDLCVHLHLWSCNTLPALEANP